MDLRKFFLTLPTSPQADPRATDAWLAQATALARTRLQEPAPALPAAASQDAQFSEEQLRWLRDFAHDMRTPLASILTLCEQMKAGAGGDVTSTERTLNHARLLMQMMDGFIAQSQAEAAELHKRERVLHDLVEESMVQTRDLAQSRGMRLKLAPSDTCFFVQVASDLMVRALNNVLVNAVKYGQPDSTVGICMQPRHDPQGTRVVLEVHNQIASLPPPVPVITKSCGLGLDFVRKVASMHAGCFELDLQPQGTALARLTLPCEVEAL